MDSSELQMHLLPLALRHENEIQVVSGLSSALSEAYISCQCVCMFGGGDSRINKIYYHCDSRQNKQTNKQSVAHI